MNWTDKPDGDGYYWLRLGENDYAPSLLSVDGKRFYQFNTSSVSRVSEYTGKAGRKIWQWQKVKPYEP